MSKNRHLAIYPYHPIHAILFLAKYLFCDSWYSAYGRRVSPLFFLGYICPFLSFLLLLCPHTYFPFPAEKVFLVVWERGWCGFVAFVLFLFCSFLLVWCSTTYFTFLAEKVFLVVCPPPFLLFWKSRWMGRRESGSEVWMRRSVCTRRYYDLM